MFYFIYWIALHSSAAKPHVLTIGLKQPVQKVVQRAMTNVDCVINMDNILYAEVSTPAKNSILPNFGDEALDSWGVFADVSKACTVAEFASINQIHVNGMPHKVVADFRRFHYGSTDCPSSVFPEGAGQMDLKKRNHFSQIYTYENCHQIHYFPIWRKTHLFFCFHVNWPSWNRSRLQKSKEFLNKTRQWRPINMKTKEYRFSRPFWKEVYWMEQKNRRRYWWTKIKEDENGLRYGVLKYC